MVWILQLPLRLSPQDGLCEVGFRTRLCKVFLCECFGHSSLFNGSENVRWQSCKPKWDFLTLENSQWISIWYPTNPNDIRLPTRGYVFTKSPAKGMKKHFCFVKESYVIASFIMPWHQTFMKRRMRHQSEATISKGHQQKSLRDRFRIDTAAAVCSSVNSGRTESSSKPLHAWKQKPSTIKFCIILGLRHHLLKGFVTRKQKSCSQQ